MNWHTSRYTDKSRGYEGRSYQAASIERFDTDGGAGFRGHSA